MAHGGLQDRAAASLIVSATGANTCCFSTDRSPANQVFSLTKPFTEKICLESKRELMILLKKFASLSNRLFNLTKPCWAKSYSTLAPGSLIHHKAENRTEAKSYEHLMSS